MLNRITRGHHDALLIFRIHDEKVQGHVTSALSRLQKEYNVNPVKHVFIDVQKVHTFAQDTCDFLQQLILYFQVRQARVFVTAAEHLKPEVVKTLFLHCTRYPSLREAFEGLKAEIAQDSQSQKDPQKGFFSGISTRETPDIAALSEEEPFSSDSSRSNKSTDSHLSALKLKLPITFSYFRACFKQHSVPLRLGIFLFGVLLCGIVFLGGKWWISQQLPHAVVLGDLAYIERAFVLGIPLHKKHGEDTSLLLLALLSQQADIARFLIKQNIDMGVADSAGRTPLMYAAVKGEVELAKLLLEKNENLHVQTSLGENAIILALKHNHLAMVHYLLAQGAFIDTGSAYWQQTFKGIQRKGTPEIKKIGSDLDHQKGYTSESVIQLLQKGNEGELTHFVESESIKAFAEPERQLIFQETLQKGDLLLLQSLIQKGVNINQLDDHGETLLIRAAFSGQKELIEKLLQLKADPNITASNTMMTPLMWAAYRGESDILRLLIEAQADVNRTNPEGWTAIMWAVDQGHLKATWFLITQKAKLNLQNHLGMTPLMFAVRKGHVSLAGLLLSNKASLDLNTNTGKTVFDFANESGNLEMIKMLFQTKLGNMR
ncbi:ankyrin repeat domain-containing protein [Deltaproteobacteria bacterium TL4]